MNVVIDHPGVSTLVGTPKEVQARLGKSHADQVLLVTFDHIRPRVLEALAANVANVTSSMFELMLERHDRESIERLVDVLMPRTPPSPACSRKRSCWCRRAKPCWRAVTG